MAGALAQFWKLRGYLREGSEWLARLLAAGAGTGGAQKTKALHVAGMLAFDMGDYEIAQASYKESLAIHQERNHLLDVAHIQVNLGNVAYRQGDNGAARFRYEQGLALYRELGQRWGIASALGSLGNVEDAEENYPAAHACQEESLALSRRLGDARMTAYTLHNLGNLAVREGDTQPRAGPLRRALASNARLATGAALRPCSTASDFSPRKQAVRSTPASAIPRRSLSRLRSKTSWGCLTLYGLARHRGRARTSLSRRRACGEPPKKGMRRCTPLILTRSANCSIA